MADPALRPLWLQGRRPPPPQSPLLSSCLSKWQVTLHSLLCPPRGCPTCMILALPGLCDGARASQGMLWPADRSFLSLPTAAAHFCCSQCLLCFVAAGKLLVSLSVSCSHCGLPHEYVWQCHNVFSESSSATSQAHTDACFPSSHTQEV